LRCHDGAIIAAPDADPGRVTTGRRVEGSHEAVELARELAELGPWPPTQAVEPIHIPHKHCCSPFWFPNCSAFWGGERDPVPIDIGRVFRASTDEAGAHHSVVAPLLRRRSRRILERRGTKCFRNPCDEAGFELLDALAA